MASGGKRDGAGRPRGPSPRTREARELAARVLEDGVTPLEVLITTMRGLWREANAGSHINLSKRMQACMLAEKAAPYIHPKLAMAKVDHTSTDGSMTPKPAIDATQLSSEALREIVAAARASDKS